MIAMHDGGTIAIVLGPSAASTCRTDSASTQPGHAACPEQRMSSCRSSSLCMRITSVLARPPEEHCAPPLGAANKVSVGVVHLTQTDSGRASLAFAMRTNSQILFGETLTPPTPAR